MPLFPDRLCAGRSTQGQQPGRPRGRAKCLFSAPPPRAFVLEVPVWKYLFRSNRPCHFHTSVPAPLAVPLASPRSGRAGVAGRPWGARSAVGSPRWPRTAGNRCCASSLSEWLLEKHINSRNVGSNISPVSVKWFFARWRG